MNNSQNNPDKRLTQASDIIDIVLDKETDYLLIAVKYDKEDNSYTTYSNWSNIMCNGSLMDLMTEIIPTHPFIKTGSIDNDSD